ncbi:MAG: cobalamin-dependent protein [Nitrospinota bacterium]|nr:cobalamin-dependent protein [Nitrospinota bacterium]
MNSPKPWPEPSPVDRALLESIRKAVVEYDEAMVLSACSTVVDRGMDAYMAIFDGLVAGMEEVGGLFDRQEYFVPELLMCADTVYAGLNMLRPHVRPRPQARPSGTALIGVIEGDIHDIGKNMVKMVFEIAGYKINDLGSDVGIRKFVQEATESKPDLILVSVMMTTCVPRVKDLVIELRKAAPWAPIMVGGCSMDEETVYKLGGDGAAPDAHNALRVAVALMEKLRSEIKGRQGE